MSPNAPGDVPPAGPPKGLLAAVAAGQLAAETVTEEPVLLDAHGNHQASSVDPSYEEPSPPEDYTAVLAMYDAERDAAGDPLRTIASLMRLVGKCIGRIEVLETALRPFANQSVQIANAKMCLLANNRPNEPAGGLWVSGVQSIHCSPAESLFYNAADTYGRKRVEDNMARAFERVRKAQEAQNEQSVHIEGGGKLQ